MALILSAATGNFNAGATWVGGIVPGAADEARASTAHTVTITANVTCTELSNDGTGIFTLNSGVTLTTNVTSKSTTATRNCLQFTSASPLSATIVGTCTGGTVSTAQGVVNTSTGSLAITGNVSAGAGTSSVGVNNSSTGTVTITGIATAGSTNGAEGARNAVGGVLNVGRAKGNDFGIGSTGIVAGVGVTSGQTSVTKVKEIEYGTRGQSPTSGPIYLDSDLTNVAVFVNYPTGTKTLSDPNNTAGLSPADTDVRSGVVYNNGNDTGSAYIPAASSVGFGVPVDATTGTAVLTASAIFDTLTSTMTTSGSIGERLANVSTVAVTGQQITNALG